MKNLPLTQKMIIAFLVVAVLPLLGSFAVNAYLTYDELQQNTQRALHGAATAAATAVDEFLLDNLHTIRIQSLLPDVITYLSLPAERRRNSREETNVIRVLDAFRRRDHVNIVSCALYDQEGRKLLDTLSGEGGAHDLPLLTLAEIIHRGTPVVSDIQRTAPRRAANLAFFSPVRNAEGDIIGIVRTRFNASAIQKIVFENEGRLGPGSLAIIVDEKGARIADSHDPALTVKDALSVPSPVGGNSHTLFSARLYPPGDDEYLCVAVRITTKPWTLISAMPKTAFVAVAQRQFFSALFLIVLFASLATVAAVFAARTLARPLVELTDHARRIAGGAFDGRLTSSSRDEIGPLTQTINDLTAAIANYH
ncbi:MAG: HAMP domain-containing protein, partial [Syntrophales bacterium]|nr:HAMP domain-containing protein [Syntrophales bacterium]